MNTKDWYKITFQIESNLEDLIIWKFNELGISSYAFEYVLNSENKKKVYLWIPTSSWDEISINNLEIMIIKLLKIKDPNNKIFDLAVMQEEDWLTSWKKYWGPELVGEHLVILPCWMNLNEKFQERKIIKIDPGAAFGTGSHPSTYLCLERMEDIVFSGKKVLDIGSGSGILTIAAKSLGAKEICAVDNDYLAINSTKSNFQINFGNTHDLKTYLGSFDEVFNEHSISEFDFILCNILAEVIKELIPIMNKCLKNNGKVILSGILNSQKDEIIKILNLNHLKFIELSSKKDWVCIAAQKSCNLTYA